MDETTNENGENGSNEVNDTNEQGTLIKASSPKRGGIAAQIRFDFKGSGAEAIAEFGDNVVHQAAIASWKIRAQADMRRLLDSGKSPEEVVRLMTAWRPGQSVGDTTTNLIEKFKSMSAEDRAKLIEQLMAEAD